ncbi:MAG: type II toxin-antitoxin system HicA family toxin [Spirochaetes bacterium]|nr:type II toxin-antitoxin system HicA family toxin [Spirochaetota bacterium]
MKRQKFIDHLRLHSCIIAGEGGKHSILQNLKTGKKTTLPRHNEIQTGTMRAICRRLDIPAPVGK